MKIDKIIYNLRGLVEQYYDVQKQRIEAYNRIVAWVKSNIGWEGVVLLQAKEALGDKFNPNDIPFEKDYKSTIEAIELKYSVIIPPLDKPYSWYADKMIKDKISKEEVENIVWVTKELIRLEKDIKEKIKPIVEDFQIYTDYLSKIRGIGHTLAAGLIAWTAPISRFEYSSRLRAYAGLVAQHYKLKCEEGHKIIATSPKEQCPVRDKNKKNNVCESRIVQAELVSKPPKRERGYFTMINTRLKTHLVGRIAGGSFEKQSARRSYYRYLYDRIKAYYTSKFNGKTSKAHIRSKTLLWVASMFTSHLWEVWRRIEDLPVTEPYPVAKLGHTKIIPMTDEDSPLVPMFKYSEAVKILR